MSAAPETRQARPFLKWAGGKGQLIGQIARFLPPSLKTGRAKTYLEPFLGGGAVYFWLASNYTIERAYLYERDPAVAACYQAVQGNARKLIKELKALEKEYMSISSDARKDFFYARREEFNQSTSKEALAPILIFLNRTCFNGLYRLNSRGKFNVPFGRHKNPTICNEDNLLAAHGLLQNAEIHCADFAQCLEHADKQSFVYLDPPYRPISPTAHFTSYAKDKFDDSEQKRLRDVFRKLDNQGAKAMLSNSDPKNTDPKDNFFDDLYRGYSIQRINATRQINRNPDRRGAITEILVMNY